MITSEVLPDLALNLGTGNGMTLVALVDAILGGDFLPPENRHMISVSEMC